MLLERQEEELNAKVVRLGRYLRRSEGQDIGVATSHELVLACFSTHLLEMNVDWLRQQMTAQYELVVEILRIYDQRHIFVTENIKAMQDDIWT